MQKGFKAWLKALYTRKNPYTGLTLAEDPAVAIIELQNEDSLLWWGFSNIKGDAQILLRRLFADFLKKKYGSLEKARAGLAELRRRWSCPMRGTRACPASCTRGT